MGFHLILIELRKNDLQEIVYTTLLHFKVINASFAGLHLSVAKLIPSEATQVFFNESIKNGFTLSFDFWKTDKN